MCTAVTYKTRDFYFGRTLDYECSYGEEVVVVPRRYPFPFKQREELNRHYAMIGMAHVAEGYPLFYDAVNEKGLGIAGLNFVGNACYNDPAEGENNIAQYELIPWILGTCASVDEAEKALKALCLTNLPFSERFPLAQLHWILSDKRRSITAEWTKEGAHIYDNPVGVLTNNPPFPVQIFNLNNYMHVSTGDPQNHFSTDLELQRYSRGMGGIGLPGDLSSASRFVRAAFTKLNSRSGESERESVSQFFHILGSVEQQRGCCLVGLDKYELTIYASCCNADKGIYYYKTYDNHRIIGIDMYAEDLDAEKLRRFPLILNEPLFLQNR